MSGFEPLNFASPVKRLNRSIISTIINLIFDNLTININDIIILYIIGNINIIVIVNKYYHYHHYCY